MDALTGNDKVRGDFLREWLRSLEVDMIGRVEADD